MEESHFTPLPYGKYILIGRKSCNINVNDIRISSVHCEVGSVKMEGWDMFPSCTAYVEDKSSNGTWMCRKEGLHSWGECRKLTKEMKINFSPGDFILLLPPSVEDVPDYCAFSLEANELSNKFGLKHLTVAELKKRTAKSSNGDLNLVGTVKRSISVDAPEDSTNKKRCLEEPVKLEPCSKPDPKVGPPPEVPPITTQSSMEQCPHCLKLFPLEELVTHSEVCRPLEDANALFMISEPDGAAISDDNSLPSYISVDLTGPPRGGTDLEQCMHCLKDFSVVELVTHVNICSKRIKPSEDLKELEHCEYCLNLFPLDEIVNHCMICTHKCRSGKSDENEEEVLERCMHCFKDFPISELVRHMPECTGDMCGPKERFKGFVPSVHDIDAMAVSVLNDTQRRAVDYVIQQSEEDSRRALPSLLGRVKRLGYIEKDLERTLLWVKLSAPIIIHVHLDRVLGFLVKDTHYRNLFETLTGSGSTDQHARASWEDRIFNNVYHDSSPVERVKYGVLNIVGDLRGVRACYSYGDSFLQLKKVRLRTTFASMDTSSGSVKLSCCEHYGNVLNEYSDPELKAIIDVATRRTDHLKSDMISNYKEIEEFSEQLQDHFDDIQEVFCSDLDFPDDCSCAIGSEEDRGNLVKGQEEMSTTVNSLLDETKDLTNMVEGMMDEVLECRSLYEEANDAIRMRNSDHYREYVRKKPLTPLLQNLLDKVHAQYTIAEARVRELSAQIDADVERRKELEAIRVGGARPPLHTPTYHNIYTTLKNNRRITRLQSTSIDHLVEKMKNMTVIPRAWNFSSPAPTASLSSSIHDKPTRQSQALLNEVKGVGTPGKQTKKKKQPLFKYSPERLSQLQELFESSVQSTSMQTIPVVTSFTHKSPTHSSRSTTPVLDDNEDSVIEPHTPPTFLENQPGKLLHQRQGNSSVNQPLQGAPFVSQVSRLLQSTESDPLPQEIPQLPGLHHPLSNPPYGLPPLNQVLPDLSQGGSTLQSKAGPTGQAFPSQVYVSSVLPPPPPSQPPSQDHVIHHGGTSSTVTTKGPTVTAKTPSEMAAEAALKRQQSACGANTVTVQNVVVTTAVTKTPVVVITASEMPPSSLFFTGKSQTKPPVTESTTGVRVFGTPLLDHSTSIPANFQFNFSAQNPTLKMPPFFASTTGSQTSLAYGLSASNNDKFSSMSSLLSKSETSFLKPATGTAPPQAGNLLSKSESSLFKTGVTTSGNKPSSLLYSFNASESSITDSLTKPFSRQKESEVTSEEETEQSEDEQDETLTKSPADNDSTAATPILSLNTKSVLSGSMPTLATPVTATPAVAPTTIKSSVTFSAPSTLSINKPTLISTKAPPTSVATTAPPPTLPTATTAPPTSNVISSTTTLSSVVVSTAPPTLISDSLPMTSTAPPTLIADSLAMTSTAPPILIADSLAMTSTAPPTLIADSLPPTSVTKSSTTSEISSTISTSGASPVTESAAPPISETTGAPPIAEGTAPPTTTSATTPISTTAVAAPTTTTTVTTTSAVTINPISVVPPTPSTTAPPAILSIMTTEATTVSNPPTLTVPLFRVADKPSDSEGESDVIDNGLDRVASQSSLNSNMSDEINIVDDSEGEMDKEPVQSKETPLNQGFTSLFGEKKMATNSTSNPFGSLGNVSDNSSGVHSAHTPSVGSGSHLLAPSKFQSGFGQSSGLGIGMQSGWGLGQTGMGAGQTGMGVGQTGMGVGQTGMGVSQTGMGVGQTGMGVGQTGMGVGQTGMGAGNNASALGAKFGSSPLFAAQAQFGRPAMGSSIMGSTTNTRVFGSSMDSDGATSFSSLASGGHGGQTFGGIGIGTGMGGVNKSSFQAWR